MYVRTYVVLVDATSVRQIDDAVMKKMMQSPNVGSSLGGSWSPHLPLSPVDRGGDGLTYLLRNQQ